MQVPADDVGEGMKAAWLAVASADHVRRGLDGGFMQVGHGKGAPLRRISSGDGVVYYAPTEHFGEKQPCRAFVAIGLARQGPPYQVEMSPEFHPWRRDVDWLEANRAPIAPLLPHLSFTAGRPNWGAALRFGFLSITTADFALIRAAMTGEGAGG